LAAAAPGLASKKERLKPPVPVLMMVRELDLGGIERDVSKLARHIDRSRFEPHVASYLPFGARFQELSGAGIPVLHLPVTSLFSRTAVQSAFLLRRYLRERRIRIVHAFDAPTDIFGIPLARLFRVPVSIASQLWVHGISPGWYARLVLGSCRLSTAVYVNCNATKRQLVEERGQDPNRVFVCHNGVETDVFHPPGQPRAAGAPSPRGHPPDAPVVIGSIAVLRPEKSLTTLLKAFALVLEGHPQARLVIAGQGPMLPQLEAQRRQLGIGHACRFLPPPESVADLMRTIDVYVLPSLSEAFSNALLEAMACGCCPVGSRVGGTPELIAEGERGLLFEPGNAGELAAKLALLVENPGLRRTYGDASAAFAHGTLDIRMVAGRLADFYTRLLERSEEG
jgi:glycosyltransferase involved in cell wall biosynthesis